MVLGLTLIWNIPHFIARPVVQTREENIQQISTIQYSSTNNMQSRFNINPVTPPAPFENQTFGWVLIIN